MMSLSKRRFLGARITLWTLQPGRHPLQLWIQAQYRALPFCLHGVANFGCLFVHRARVTTNFSAVLDCMYALWLQMFQRLKMGPVSLPQYLEVNIWGDPAATRTSTILVANSGLSHMLITRGINRVVQLWDFTTEHWAPASDNKAYFEPVLNVKRRDRSTRLELHYKSLAF